MADLRDKLCCSRRKTCQDKQRTKRTEIIRRFSPGGKHKKATGLRQRSTILEKKMSCFTTKLLWRTPTTQLRKLNEYKIQSIGFLSINAEGSRLPRQQRPDYAAAKKNVSDYKTSIWRKQSSSTHQFIRANKYVRIRINNSMKVKIMITLWIGKQDGDGTTSSRETCRILRLRRPHHGRIPQCKIGNHGGGILRSLTKGSE